MKTRTEVLKFAEKQFADNNFMKGSCSHYGKEAVRQLLDFIYEGEPKKESEKVLTKRI